MGSDDNVSIQLVGDKDVTDFHDLDLMLRNDFEPNQEDKFTFKDRNIGEYKYILLKKTPGFMSKVLGRSKDWVLDRIIVSHEWREDVHFVFSSFVTAKSPDPLVIVGNQTKLPQEECPTRKMARSMETFAKKKFLYQWSYEHTSFNFQQSLHHPHDARAVLPGFKGGNYDELDGFQKHHEKDYADYQKLKKYLQDTAIGKKVESICNGEDFQKFDDFKIVSDDVLNCMLKCETSVEPHKAWIKDWKTDREFGRQALNGSYPVYIRRIKKLPENFGVTEESVKGLLKRDLTLEEEFCAGNMYLIDLEILEGISTGRYAEKKLELAVPLILYYLPPNQILTPIAIQLGQKPCRKFPVWTPNDKAMDWLLAKVKFKECKKIFKKSKVEGCTWKYAAFFPNCL